ncbi:Cu(I)-responsive transcriptional regulator [Vibrio salinus]|uniref:Cu(I)-responsive transcriptional regulator n=1 Tax=Vibrio salinus TaxID=2899784 RepID=UPI001E28C9F8|nr:Cu(I)-responsive transcriptional regulator [Vibrio salinus]MCE0493002.1 Cu(I)-responsive transcriptional regulator [Vibrio salinus]
MNISEVVKLTGLTAKSIRLYEDKGLITPPPRGENGYRHYNRTHLDELQLIGRAKRVGFSLEECRALVALANDPERRSAAVKEKAQEKLVQVEAKLSELEQIKQQLEHWIMECPGNDDSDCPIIDDLTGSCHQ